MLIGAGLKMYLGHAQTREWVDGVAELARVRPGVRAGDVELLVLPSFPSLTYAVEVLTPVGVRVGAQDVSSEDSGPFTGEVSAQELAELGCRYVLVGHAERRRLFGETDEVVSAKTAAALRHGLTPVVCVGEAGQVDPVAAAARCVHQLRSALADALTAGMLAPVVVAYEPVWAIGAAAAADAGHIGTVCRELGAALAGDPALAGSRVVYGGSAGPGLLEAVAGTVDGLLLGRASHDPARLGHVLDEALRSAPHGNAPQGNAPHRRPAEGEPA